MGQDLSVYVDLRCDLVLAGLPAARSSRVSSPTFLSAAQNILTARTY